MKCQHVGQYIVKKIDEILPNKIPKTMHYNLQFISLYSGQYAHEYTYLYT